MTSFGMKRVLPIIGVILMSSCGQRKSRTNGCTTTEECDEYAFSNEEECDEWLRERGIEGYGSNFFVESYIG